MPITLLIPFAELAGIAIGTLATAAGLDLLSKKVESYIEDNPENAQKIFSIIMPEQGLANILKNESGDEEVIETEEVVEEPKLTGKEKGKRIKAAIKRARAGRGNYSSEDAEGPAVDIGGSVIREVEDMGIADKNLKDNYKPSGYTGWKRFANKGKKKYADGGGVGSMMQRKSFRSGGWSPGVGRDESGYQSGHGSYSGGNNNLVSDVNIKEIIDKKIAEKFKTPTPVDKNKLMFEDIKKYQTLNKNLPFDFMPGFHLPKTKTKNLYTNSLTDLNLMYPNIKIENEYGMVDKDKAKSLIDRAILEQTISPVDGLNLTRSIDTTGTQSNTSGDYTIGNFNFNSPNIEEGILNSGVNYNLGDLNLNANLNTNDSTINDAKLGFNYGDGALTGSTYKDKDYNYAKNKLGIDKEFNIGDNFKVGLDGNYSNTIFDGENYRNSDLTPSLSYDDGTLNANLSKEIVEGGTQPNLGIGFNTNGFYGKAGNLLSNDPTGVLGYQKNIGSSDGPLQFSIGAEKNLFNDGYTGGLFGKYTFQDGGMAGDKTYHQYHDQHVPMDLEGIMGYAHGGDIAIQGGVKNYLGEQKMVTVPQKWQSAEDHPQTELAYITNREKNLLLKKDLHDSLKGGANKGPEGVMSLNGWGDAPGGSKGGGKGGSSGGNNRFADYSYNKAERYATPKGVPIGPGGLRVGQGGNTTGALGTTGTGSNIDFVDQKYSGDGIFSGYRNLDKFGQPKMGLAYGLDRLKNFIPSLMGMAMGIPGVGSATNFLKNKFGKGVVEEEQTISPYQLNSLGKYVYNEDPKNMFTDNFSDQKINNVKANVTSPNGELIELGNNFANPGGFETPPASEYEGMWGNDLQNSMEQDYGMYEAPPPASEYEGMWGNDLQNSMEQDYGMYVPSYPSGNPGGTTNSNFANPGGTTNSNFANPGGDTFPYQKSVNNAAMEIMSNAYKDRYHNFANPGGTTNSNFANPGGTTNSNFANPGGITSITNNELPGNNIVAGNYSQNAVSNQLYGKDYDLLDPFDQQKLDSLIDQVGTKSTGELARNGGMMGVGSMFVNKR